MSAIVYWYTDPSPSVSAVDLGHVHTPDGTPLLEYQKCTAKWNNVRKNEPVLVLKIDHSKPVSELKKTALAGEMAASWCEFGAKKLAEIEKVTIPAVQPPGRSVIAADIAPTQSVQDFQANAPWNPAYQPPFYQPPGNPYQVPHWPPNYTSFSAQNHQEFCPTPAASQPIHAETAEKIEALAKSNEDLQQRLIELAGAVSDLKDTLESKISEIARKDADGNLARNAEDPVLTAMKQKDDKVRAIRAGMRVIMTEAEIVSSVMKAENLTGNRNIAGSLANREIDPVKVAKIRECFVDWIRIKNRTEITDVDKEMRKAIREFIQERRNAAKNMAEGGAPRKKAKPAEEK